MPLGGGQGGRGAWQEGGGGNFKRVSSMDEFLEPRGWLAGWLAGSCWLNNEM